MAKIRKQACRLSASDFLDFPAWEYALDEEGEEGQDEATVRPYPFEGVLDPWNGAFLVRAAFVLADGTRLPGHITISHLTIPEKGDSERDLSDVHPTILAPRGQVGFWLGTVFDPEVLTREIAALYERLGKTSPSQVFPVRYVTDAPLIGGAINGEIPGFMVLERVARAVT